MDIWFGTQTGQNSLLDQTEVAASDFVALAERRATETDQTCYVNSENDYRCCRKRDWLNRSKSDQNIPSADSEIACSIGSTSTIIGFLVSEPLMKMNSCPYFPQRKGCSEST